MYKYDSRVTHEFQRFRELNSCCGRTHRIDILRLRYGGEADPTDHEPLIDVKKTWFIPILIILAI